MADNSALYHPPAVLCPSVEELAELSEKLRLKFTSDDIKDVQEFFKSTASSLQKLSNLQQPSLPVKYPRTPGHKPSKGDNPFNAWAWRCDIQGAASGKLKGKIVCVKDSIAVAGIPMSGGSRVLDGYIPEYDATVVCRVLDEGGRITGKAACESFCYSGASFTGDDGPVTNPHDITRTTGGSSSGCAALLSSGNADMAIGGDQAGSIRVPSSWSGVVGLKPTFGLVPFTGAMSMEPTQDHLGPMAKTVNDCALLLEVIAGIDEDRDSRQSRSSTGIPEYSKLTEQGIDGKKIGLLREGFEVCTETDVADLVKREAMVLQECGALVDEVSIPMHLDGPHIWSGIALQGNRQCMINSSGSGYFRKGFQSVSLQEAICKGVTTRPYDLSGNHRTFYLLSEYLEKNYQNKFYTIAQNMSLVLNRAYNDVLEKYDVLVMPTLPFKAPKMPSETARLSDLLSAGTSMFTNTCPFNCTGQPALTVNAGFIEGLPVGMQIVGRHFDETAVLQVARAYEKKRDGE